MTVTSAPGFEALPEWGSGLPDLRAQDVSDITSDADGNVYLLYRNPSFVAVCSADGSLLRTIGEGVLGSHAHGVTVGPDRRVYVVDSRDNCMRIFDEDGSLAQVFGSGPTNPAFAGEVTGEYIDHIDRAYPPFSWPTRVAVTEDIDMYVADGYGNCRVHRFGADCVHLSSWGEPGIGPGQFHTPHDIALDKAGRILVCDRENDRVQLFDREGTLLDQWTDLRRPQALVQGPDDLYYVAEGAWRPGHVSPVHGRVEAASSRVSILSHDGSVVGRVGGESPGTPGSFIAAHGITMDPRGDLYVAEVSFSVSRRFRELGGEGCVAVQKLRRT